MPTTLEAAPGLSAPLFSGDAFERGQAQGREFGPLIAGALDALERLELFRQEQPAWLPYGLYRWLAERRARALLEPALWRDYPEAAARLKGMAMSSGVPYRSLYLMNAIEPFLSSLNGRVVLPQPAACSAVAVRGRRSATGEPMLVKNFDYLPLAQPFYAFRRERPRTGSGTLLFSPAPLAGAVDGMNEHGLCVTYNYAYTTEGPQPSGTVGMLIGELLERCKTVEEAWRWVSARPRWGGALLMLADADGDIASLEVSSTKAAIRRPAAGEDVLFHTNAFCSQELREVEVARTAVFAERAPKALRGKRVHDSAERRWNRIDQLLGGRIVGADDLHALLSDHGGGADGGDTTLCVHGSYWQTTGTFQYFPRSRKVRASFTNPCSARWSTLEL